MTFRERRENHRSKCKKKEKESVYSWSDFLWDVLFYFPELLFLPFRLLWWGVKAIVKIFRFDYW